jgi:DNA polymerase-3 subunit epsilon
MIIFLDTETTGLGQQDAIVEVAAIGADGTVLLDTLVEPLAPIGEKAQAIHGIGDTDLKGAPSLAEVATRLRQCLEMADQVWAYNADFDRRLIWQSAALAGTADLEGAAKTAAWHDLMQAATRAITGEVDAAWWSQEEVAHHLGLDMGTLHRARSDAELSRKIYLSLLPDPNPVVYDGAGAPNWAS